MRTGVIRASWLAVESRMDAEFWLTIIEILRQQGIEPGQATQEQVRAAVAKRFRWIDKRLDEARRLRAEAAVLVEQARVMEAEVGKPRRRFP